MQAVNDMLDFNIETPSDAELYARFHDLDQLMLDDDISTGDDQPYVAPKKRNRKSNKQKRLERIERDA